MNTFVKQKLKLFVLKAGNVFYEFKDDQPEDLQYYKEVLYVPENMVIFWNISYNFNKNVTLKNSTTLCVKNIIILSAYQAGSRLYSPHE